MKHLDRRKFLQKIGVAGLGLSVGSTLWAGSKLDTQVDPNVLARVNLRVATYKGDTSYFSKLAGVADLPFKVTTAEFAGGNLIAEAISAGSLDVGGMSEIPPIFTVPYHAPLKLISVLHGDVNNQVVLVPKDSRLRDTAELKGKRIGYVRSTTSHYFLLRLLREKGLSFKDITPIALSPQDGLAAFQSNQLDAWVIYGVHIEFARAKGARVLKTALGYLSGNYTIAASQAAIDDPVKQAAIALYLQREQQIYNWINTHPDLWAARISEVTGVPKEFFLRQYHERSSDNKLSRIDANAIRSQQAVADLFADAGVIPHRIDVTPLWDTRFNPVII